MELALRLKPDVAVLDFSMPDINGLDAMIEIRKVLPETEVLIVTMHDSEKLAQEARRAGARGLLLKTDARRHLAPAVQALARRQPFFTDAPSNSPGNTFYDSTGEAAALPAAGERLTPREQEILQLVAAGLTSKDVAKTLDISAKAVEAHRASIMDKLGLRSIGELVRYAIRNNIVEA